jgi:putative transcriptional regulator
VGDESLAGRLLVATPRLGDENFRRAVVLLLDHDEAGALGVVVNRPSSVQVAAVLPTWQPYTCRPGVLFQGGPVARDSALGLARVPGDDEPLGWRRVSGSLGLVDLDAPPEVLAAEMGALRIFAGYAGWAGGQLEAEIDEDAWYVVPAEPADPFSETPDQLWRAVLRRQPGDLALVSTYPEDPSLN